MSLRSLSRVTVQSPISCSHASVYPGNTVWDAASDFETLRIGVSFTSWWLRWRRESVCPCLPISMLRAWSIRPQRPRSCPSHAGADALEAYLGRRLTDPRVLAALEAADFPLDTPRTRRRWAKKWVSRW